jgi:hypothetical protein
MDMDREFSKENPEGFAIVCLWCGVCMNHETPRIGNVDWGMNMKMRYQSRPLTLSEIDILSKKQNT